MPETVIVYPPCYARTEGSPVVCDDVVLVHERNGEPVTFAERQQADLQSAWFSILRQCRDNPVYE